MRFSEPTLPSNPRSPVAIGVIATLLAYFLSSEFKLSLPIQPIFLVLWYLVSITLGVLLKGKVFRGVLAFVLVFVSAVIRHETDFEVNPQRGLPMEAPPREATLGAQIIKTYNSDHDSARSLRGLALINDAPPEQPYFKNRKILFELDHQDAQNETFREGDVLRLRGIVEPLESSPFSDFLSSQGVSHQITANQTSLIKDYDSINHRLRSHLSISRYHWIDLIQGYFQDSPDTAAVLIALSLGETRYLSDSAHRNFFETGTLHIFAISGLHIMAVFMILRRGCRLVKIRRRSSTVLAATITGMFILLTGCPPSAVRAYAILLILYFAKIVQRRQQSFATLTACALLYLWISPAAFHSLGFALSFSVVAAILLIGLPMISLADRWMQGYEAPRPSLLTRWYRKTIKRGLVNSFCISLAAFIGSAPWILANYGSIAPFGIFANVFIVFIGMATLFAIFIIAPLVILFPNTSFLLELPALGAKSALLITDYWNTWPIMLNLGHSQDTTYLPLLCILLSFGYLYRLRIRLIPVKISHLGFSCIPVISYGLYYSLRFGEYAESLKI